MEGFQANLDIRGFGDVVSLYQGQTESALKTDVQRLSSGLRINTSADDPSGLAISEKLQTKVNGLDQGQQSIQDATNALSVADGALQTISDILQRIRTLVVAANSDLESSGDKADVQTELNQLTDEINTISQNTEFNGKKLLDGSLSSDSTLPARLIIGSGGTLSSGGTLFDSIVDPAQPSIPSANAPQFAASLTVQSYDPTTGIVTVAFQAEGADTGTFGPTQTASLQVQAGTNYQIGDFPPTPGTPEFTLSSFNNSGQPVLGFNIGTINADDVGATQTVVSLSATVKAPGQALEVNTGDAEGTVISVDIPAVNSINLGVSDVQVGDSFTNQAAEYRVDYGIQTLANVRAQVGAQTVSLQESASDAAIADVNYQSAESNIRDTDIGQTTTDFVRQQIQVSVQTAILSRLYGQAPEVVALVQGSFA